MTNKFNRFFWDSFSDVFMNDKNIHSRALNEDKFTARKMYNVIKNVEMFSNDVLDNNTLIDKNIFEIPVFDEIIEN